MASRRAWPDYAYRRRVEALGLGASYGNRLLFMPTGRESDLLGVWGREDRFFLGSLHLHPEEGGRPFRAGQTVFADLYQTTFYRRGRLYVKKQVFLPFGTSDDERAFLRVRVRNTSRRHRVVDLPVEIFWSAREFAGLKVPPGQEQNRPFQITERVGGLIVRSLDRPAEVRVLRTNLPAEVVKTRGSHTSLRYRLTLSPGEIRNLEIILTFGRERELPADPAGEADKALRESLDRMRGLLFGAAVWSPSPLINRGVYWAKVNLLRIQHDFLAGPGFTNDPPQDIVVLRDAAWFVGGADYLTPAFDREMLLTLLREGVGPDGRVSEYLRLSRRPVFREDYGLNVNDDAPLLIIACAHHYFLTGDRSFLAQAYPILKRIGHYLLSQRWLGLVYTQPGTENVWGISGWRNIIPEYSLDGAVTEINAETYAALRHLSALAREMGDAAEAEGLVENALDLAERIESELRQPDGLYLLARDAQGRRRRDRTGDLIFPVLFGPAGPKSRSLILDTLHSEEFWALGGCRTVSPSETNYDPDHGCQLLGGIWPNLMAWVAWAARREHPSWPAEALENTWLLAEDPRPVERGNVVPGQFPERLHGETGHSRGMALSPWMPPTYLWLAMEGLAGLEASEKGLRIEPHLPPGWNNLAVRGVRYRGRSVSFFLHEDVLYTTEPVSSPWPTEVLPEDVSSQYRVTNVFHLALRRGEKVLLFLAGRGPARIRGPGLDRELELEGPLLLELRTEGARQVV